MTIYFPPTERDKSERIVNVYIPIKNRDRTRLLRCIKSIKNCNFIYQIVVIDYGSDKPIKPIKGVEIVRSEMKVWNKAHALNLGITQYPNNFIMTLDVDMLLSYEHLEQIRKNLKCDNFIVDTNVRRINPKEVTKDYNQMVTKSKPWSKEFNRTQFFNLANGGFQVYSRYFYKNMNGIQESLGLYHGCVDNVPFFRAKMWGLNIVDVSYPLLHMEHTLQKEQHYSQSEQEIAKKYREFKSNYLDFMIAMNIKINPEKYGDEFPHTDLFYQFKKELGTQSEMVQEAINSGKFEVTIGYKKFKIEKAKPSILITVINNTGMLPDYFVWDLFQLYLYTRNHYPDVDIQPVNACDVNSMRNLAVKLSLGYSGPKKYNYLVQLDDDHRYPPEFIVKFLDMMIENDWQVLTGLTSGKKPPYLNTQYYKLKVDINDDENHVKCKKPVNKVIEIEASGPVGMVINTKVFEKLTWPYYNLEYNKVEVIKQVLENGKVVDKKELIDHFVGGDITFCARLKEKGIPIKLDLSTNFPHCKPMFLSRGKILDKSNNLL